MPRACSTVFSAVLALCLLGCGERAGGMDEPFYPSPDGAFQAQDVPRDSVLALLRAVDGGALDTAFARLPGAAFVRRVRTEQIGADGRVLATQMRVLRYGAADDEALPAILRRDSSGAFDFGFFGAFAAPRAERTTATALAPGIVPDDPAYLSPRNRDAYTYRLLPDTTLGGRAARVIDVRARPAARDRVAIRHARFYVDRASGQLAALRMQRAKRTLLFDEDSAFYVRLQPGPAGLWVPRETRYETRTHLPLSTPRRFRTTATYTDYAPA